MKSPAWSVQKNFLEKEKEEGNITKEDIAKMLLKCRRIRAKTLFAALYLTGARVSEIINLRKKDIKFRQEGDKQLMIISLKNLKNKQRSRKLIPVTINSKDQIESFIVKYILEYIKLLKDDERLFPYSRNRAYKLIRRWFGINTQCIRHIRLTHLVMYNNFTDRKLTIWAGWSDSRMADRYVNINYRQLILD